MRINVTIELDTDELAEGQTVSQAIVDQFGGSNVTMLSGLDVSSELSKPERLKDLEEQRDALLAVDTSEEDDALDAGDWTEPPATPPSTAVAAPAAEPSAPTPPVAAPAVVPPVAVVAGVDLADGPDSTVINGVEVDSAGVPWNASIHSGNKKKYGKGSGAAKNGRWNWKRGTDETEREATAAQLAADLKSAAQPTAPAAAPAPAAPAAAPAPAAVVPIPVAENAAPAPVAPPVAQPVVAPVVQPVVHSTPPAAPQVSPAGWNWANFLEAMTATGTTAEAVLGITAQYGVTTIPELSPRVDVLEAVAVALGWPAPVAQ